MEMAKKVKKRSDKNGICLEFFEGFLRRISSPWGHLERGEYDKFAVNKIPCYAGWIFSRILADGSIAPCCRGAKKIMGNINERSFKEAWFSDEYNEFRAKAKYSSKDTAYFKDIGCLKECDNLMHNEQLHSRI